MEDELQLGCLSDEFLTELRNVLDEKIQTCHGLKNTSWAAAARQHVDYELGVRFLRETINTLQSARDNRQRLGEPINAFSGKELFYGFFELNEKEREAFSSLNRKLNSRGFSLLIRKLENGSVKGS